MPDLQNDKAEILEVLHRNRIAIWTNDFDLWASCMVQEPYLVRWGWWSGGGAFLRRGWEEISERVRRPQGMPPYSEAHAHQTRIIDLAIEVRGDVAWATYLQQYPGYEAEDHVGPGLTHEMRVLERRDGIWKIALLGFIDANAGHSGALIMRLSANADVLWKSPALQEALATNDDLAVRGGRLRFRESRAQRQFQDALRWAAEQDSGYMPATGAVPIVIDVGEGLAARVYWVMTQGPLILLSMGNPDLDRKRLDQAMLTYGLSPAQAEVARLVADGLSLTEIAARLGVTANTARTHLNRIFDKVGVRTQTALVRVLLSAAAPL